MVMAKQSFNWVVESRTNIENFAPLESWDGMASKVETVIETASKSAIPVFVENASTIYGLLESQAREARKAAIMLQRHLRLTKLIDLHESSNVIDFYIIKFPAWLCSEWLHRREERKQEHV